MKNIRVLFTKMSRNLRPFLIFYFLLLSNFNFAQIDSRSQYYKDAWSKLNRENRDLDILLVNFRDSVVENDFRELEAQNGRYFIFKDCFNFIINTIGPKAQRVNDLKIRDSKLRYQQAMDKLHSIKNADGDNDLPGDLSLDASSTSNDMSQKVDQSTNSGVPKTSFESFAEAVNKGIEQSLSQPPVVDEKGHELDKELREAGKENYIEEREAVQSSKEVFAELLNDVKEDESSKAAIGSGSEKLTEYILTVVVTNNSKYNLVLNGGVSYNKEELRQQDPTGNKGFTLIVGKYKTLECADATLPSENSNFSGLDVNCYFAQTLVGASGYIFTVKFCSLLNYNILIPAYSLTYEINQSTGNLHIAGNHEQITTANLNMNGEATTLSGIQGSGVQPLGRILAKYDVGKEKGALVLSYELKQAHTFQGLFSHDAQSLCDGVKPTVTKSSDEYEHGGHYTDTRR